MPTVTVNGTTTAYEEVGAGEPLVFLHGGEGNKRNGLDFAPALGHGIRVVAYDQRDMGESVGPDNDYTMADLADDCAELVRSLGLGRVHLWGQSFGGMLAMTVALRHPDVVKSLILSASSPGGEVGAEAVRVIRDVLVPAAQLPAEERTEVMSRHMFSDVYLAAHPEVLEAMRAAGDPNAGVDTTRRYRRWTLTWNHDCVADLDRIAAPTLVVHGSDDIIITVGVGRFLAERIPNAELAVIDGARHAVMVEARDEVAALVRGWVRRHAG